MRQEHNEEKEQGQDKGTEAVGGRPKGKGREAWRGTRKLGEYKGGEQRGRGTEGDKEEEKEPGRDLG